MRSPGAIQLARRRGLPSLLVDRIYEAPGHSKRWGSVLEALEAESGSAVMLLMPAPRCGNPGRALSPSIDPRFLDSYRRRWFEADPTAPVVGEIAEGAFRITTGTSTGHPATRAAFEREWLAPQGLCGRTSLVGVIERDKELGTSALRSFPRRHRRGPSFERRALWQALMPHLRRALRLDRRIRWIETQRHALFDALERLPFGLMLVDPSGRIVASNRAGARLLAQRDGLSVEGDGLHAASPQATERLRRALREAAGAPAGGCPGRPCVLSLPRPSGRRPLLAAPTACGCDERVELAGGADLVALYVSDLDPGAGVSAEPLRTLFRLAPAEAALAGELSAGLSLEEAAERLHITVETARSRLRQIFVKTDTHRQQDLVRLLGAGALNLLPPRGFASRPGICG